MSSNFPPQGEPEFLDSTGGRAQQPTESRSGRKAAIAAGGIIGGVVILGGAAWATTWYLSSGADAAEMLPSSTLAVAQINLDPSGDQKIEAIKTLRKFPGIEEEMDIESSSDLRKSLFEQLQKDGNCEEVDYDSDILPWLGDRMAVAAIDAGEESPSPVFVVEITDADKAVDGIDALLACGNDGETEPGYVIEGDWAVLAETSAIAEDVVAEATDSNLADDSTYRKWMNEAGGDSIVSMYAAPSAGEKLADSVPGLMGLAGGDYESSLNDDQLEELKNFSGAAVKIRFVDGSVEAEFASAKTDGAMADLIGGGDGAKVVSTLPEDTAVAFGASFGEGWLQAYLDQLAGTLGSEQDINEGIALIEDETGLSVPEDVEALTGDSFALALSSDLDVEALSNSSDLSDYGIGMKVQGDPSAIEAVLEKLRPQLPTDSWLLSETAGNTISFGPDEAWLEELAKDGRLGSSADYTDVIPESDKAAYVFYANLDAGDDWLVTALEDSGEGDDVIDNVRPLGAFGASLWVDSGVIHGSLKLTTD